MLAARPRRCGTGAQPRPATSAREPLPELGRAAVGGVAQVGAAERTLGDPPEGQHAPPADELEREAQAGLDLGSRRRPVRRARRRGGWERRSRAAPRARPRARTSAAWTTRRGRLGGAAAAQLALGGQGDPRDPGTAVAGRLAHEEQRRPGALLQVGGEPRRAGARPGGPGGRS